MTTRLPASRAILWASTSSWYYGYHLSELNFPVASLTCDPTLSASSSFLPPCLGIDPGQYAIVTAIFTIGGLCGSLVSSDITRRVGLLHGIALTGLVNALAAVVMATSVHWAVLALGRSIAGVSAGIAVCLVPPYLALVARASPELATRSGLVGSMHQMGIVVGLFVAQVVGWLVTGERGDTPGYWRGVVAFSAVASVWQIVTMHGMPSALELNKAAQLSLIGPPDEDGAAAEDQAPLLRGTDVDTNSSAESGMEHASTSTSSAAAVEQLSLRTLLSSPALRSPTLLCASILALQQLSGVNAVMFYSTPVLLPLLPGSAALIGLGITGVNALMTLPAMFLVDRVGRKRLLLFSVLWMSSMSALLGYSLNEGHRVFSALAIVAFIAAFSIGLGPIPFLFVSELVPQPAIPALSALSLSLSWILNFIIALLFLPLRDALSHPAEADPRDPRPDPAGAREGEGNVFYVFVGTTALLAMIVWRGLPAGK